MPSLPQTPLSRLPNFDPRRVAVTGIDAHLPAVPPDRLTPDALRRRFASPPVWAPEVTAERRFADRPPADAAVLIAIVLPDGAARQETTLLLTERATGMSTHSGQVAFAGGRIDPTDADAPAAARREAFEEIGLPPERVEVIGTLPTYLTGTAFTITPVVGLVTPGFTVLPNPREVADVFEVPLSFVMSPANHRRHAVDWEGVTREWFSMPWRSAEEGAKEHFIWGATAGMLRNLYRFLAAD